MNDERMRRVFRLAVTGLLWAAAVMQGVVIGMMYFSPIARAFDGAAPEA
jgi:hypothetical protein